jgi:uncharacterized protein
MLFVAIFSVLLAAAAPAQTTTGIPLDAPWKAAVYQLAQTKFHHPAWGWQHSERNYRIAMQLARDEGMRVDSDVLFAAAFLHDMAAFMPCADEKLEHGECAARESGAVLSNAGFPMEKLAAVQAAERGHMYYSDPGSSPEAIVLHDADSLDFLGEIGAARMLSLTGENAESFSRAVKTLRSFVTEIPPKLITKSAQRIGVERASALTRFLDTLDLQTFGGHAM